MAVTELCVIIGGSIAGTLTQDAQGIISFRYQPHYDGVPLSVSMPLANRTYPQKVIRPFLFGLLPDGEEQRSAIAEEYDVRPNNPVALLSHIGLDCSGSVQFCRNDRESIRAAIERTGTYVPLSDHEVALRL